MSLHLRLLHSKSLEGTLRVVHLGPPITLQSAVFYTPFILSQHILAFSLGLKLYLGMLLDDKPLSEAKLYTNNKNLNDDNK